MSSKTKLPEIKNCPNCCQSGKVKLLNEVRTHIVKNQILSGTFWFYKCENCLFQFTTDESDDLSLKNFKHKKK